MAKGDMTIELNGRRYDARTGEPVDDVPAQPRETDSAPLAQATPWPAENDPSDVDVNEKTDKAAVRPVAHQASRVHGRTKRSQTLRRKAVHKPIPLHPISSDIKRTSWQSAIPEQSVPTIKNRIDQRKLAKARATSKHDSIMRFSQASAVSAQATLDVPAYPLAQNNQAESDGNATMSSHPFLQQLLQNGIDNATSHLQPLHKPKHNRMSIKRLVPIGAACLAFVLLIGFYTYQNVPNFALRIASRQSGVTATMPKYTPPGFEFDGPIVWSDRRLTISFKDKDDVQQYKLSQQTSEWTSNNLLNDYVSASGQVYETYKQKGKTIYLYDGTATWVDGGIWYTISDASGLSSEQLLKIADSI